MKEWLKRQFISWGMVALFAAALPFLLLYVLLGFRQCWQCKKQIHIFRSYKYWTWHDRKKPERVCADCSYFLEEYDREGLQ